MKTLTAEEVKQLQVGTAVYLVKTGTGQRGELQVAMHGRKKVLRGYSTHEIEDRPGWHYEVEE